MANLDFQTDKWSFTLPTRVNVNFQTDKWTFTPPTRVNLLLQTDRWDHSFKDSFIPRIEMY